LGGFLAYVNFIICSSEAVKSLPTKWILHRCESTK
jgi:hypothetical protein